MTVRFPTSRKGGRAGKGNISTNPEKFPPKKNGFCRVCKTQTVAVLHQLVQHNGAQTFVWCCSQCQQNNPFGGEYYIAKEKVQSYLTLEQIEKLPVQMFVAEHRCVVCGERTCELHHWAPKGIFGKDASLWPTDYLCKIHHDLWHQTVTPQLVIKT